MSIQDTWRASRPLRIAAKAAVGLALLAAVAWGALYAASEAKIRAQHPKPAIALRLSAPASLERGTRLATALGCHSCHGEAGRVFFDGGAWVGRVIAPNLTRAPRAYSDEDLAVLLRAGIKRDGTSAIIMPAQSYSWLADDDVAALVAYLRALKEKPDAPGVAATQFGPLGRLLVLGSDDLFAAAKPRAPAPPAVHPEPPPAEPAPATPEATYAAGEYVYKVACMHCHALDEERETEPGLMAPPLRLMAQSYERADFVKLLRTGEPVGGRELRLMGEVAADALSHLTDAEIAALHAYLNRAEATGPEVHAAAPSRARN